MSDRVFRDRRDAGRVLAGELHAYRDVPGVVVLGLPRGGIPVAWEVAAALHAPLDAFAVRKLGAPGRPEYAMGAIASGGHVVVNEDALRGLRMTRDDLRDVVEREGRELARRENVYRAGRPPVDVAGRTAIVVDDGLATGASTRAAVVALRALAPAAIVVAVPVGPPSARATFAELADGFVCVTTPEPFFAVGESYEDFTQVTDDEVRELLGGPNDSASGSCRTPLQ